MAADKKRNRKIKVRRPRASKKPPLGKELIKAVAGLSVLLALVAVAGWMTHDHLTRKPPDQAPSPHPVPVTAKRAVAPEALKRAAVPKPVQPRPTQDPPLFEVIPKREIPHHKPFVDPAKAGPKTHRPKVAIIIDDLGYDWAMAERFIRLDAPLSFSILPFSPYQNKIADRAKSDGREVLLHLPMEPLEYPRVDPGPGALLVAMSPDELIRQLNANLDAVPFIRGVNNHMGSRITGESNQMNQIFSVLKQRSLFFVDSRTTAGTLSSQSARLFQVPFAQRDVFLDHVQEPDHIRRQIDRLVQYARLQGEAIGIGHPHRVTYETLRSLLPQLKQSVVFVPASQLVHTDG